MVTLKPNHRFSRPPPFSPKVGAREPGRRLFMGSGIGGTGVQCGVDVGFIADNIYETQRSRR